MAGPGVVAHHHGSLAHQGGTGAQIYPRQHHRAGVPASRVGLFAGARAQDQGSGGPRLSRSREGFEVGPSLVLPFKGAAGERAQHHEAGGQAMGLHQGLRARFMQGRYPPLQGSRRRFIGAQEALAQAPIHLELVAGLAQPGAWP